jgi:hypothetical protein
MDPQLNLFMKSLMTQLSKKYHEDYYIGSIYSDNKNIVYFPFTPRALK